MAITVRFNGKLNLIGDILQEARLKQGLSRAELAQKMREQHIPSRREIIYQIEKGEHRVLDTDLACLADILHLNVNEIFSEVRSRLMEIQVRKE